MGLVDAFDPAVLKLIQLVCSAATNKRIRVSVCVGLASDLIAVPVLLGLGVRTLSASVVNVPAVKALVRDLDLSECHKLASQVLDLQSAKEAREFVTSHCQAARDWRQGWLA